MLRTLQFYVGRELIKTFALTAIGLTLVFSLCGGVVNMIQVDVLSGLQILRIFGFVMPLALTLTLPVAALFACAMVYGRLAADNEFDACRASGVNIHRLLAPAVALSLFTAAFTFVFANFILPTFVGRLEAIVRKDAEQIVLSSLQTRGYIRRGPYVIYSRKAELYEHRDPGRKVVQIQNGAFLELEGENLRSAGTTRQARIDFIKPEGAEEVSVQASMFDVRRLDLKRNQFHEEAEQAIGGVKVPSLLKEKPKFLTLPRLLEYRADPSLPPRIREHTEYIQLMIRAAGVALWFVDQLAGGKQLKIEDADRRYTITAQKAVISGEDMRPELAGVRIQAVEGNQRRDYRADHASIKFKPAFAGSSDMAEIVLRGKASFTDARDPTTRAEKNEIPLEPIAVPAAALGSTAKITNQQILGLPAGGDRPINLGQLYKQEPEPLNLGPRIEDARIRTRRDMVELVLDITGIIHSRLAFSASVLVTLVLAAGLGIICRGGQMMTAFAISFIPGLLVVVMNLMGRQLTEKFSTHLAGIIVIWAAIGLVAIADAVVLAKFVKR
jgi:lipopolysaccharide export LptBFGC system permease protein LptF